MLSVTEHKYFSKVDFSNSISRNIIRNVALALIYNVYEFNIVEVIRVLYMFKYFLVINILTLPFDSCNINLEEKKTTKQKQNLEPDSCASKLLNTVW